VFGEQHQIHHRRAIQTTRLNRFLVSLYRSAYYQVITFLMENEGIQQQDEKDDDPETGRLF